MIENKEEDKSGKNLTPLFNIITLWARRPYANLF